jgi:hypothetical protein
MSVTLKNATRALAVGSVLALAGSAPAWSQSLIGDGAPANLGQYYYGSARAPYGYAAPYAYVPRTTRVHRHRHHR